MHSAFSYDRRDPYTRLPIDTSQPTGVDPISSVHSSSINSDHNVSQHFHIKNANTFKYCLVMVIIFRTILMKLFD